MPAPVPTKLDLKRDERLRVEWSDGRETTFAIAELRRLCPCAECKIARDGVDPHQLFRRAEPEAARKPRSLNVLKASQIGRKQVAVERAEPIGNYAIKLYFDDGHASGIYSWAYLLELAEAKSASAHAASSGESGGSGSTRS